MNTIIADEVRSLSIVALFLLFCGSPLRGFMCRLTSIVWGTAPDGVRRGESRDMGHVPMIMTAAVLMGFGLAIPEAVRERMDRAVAILLLR